VANRPYRLVRRAETSDATRRAILAAAVQLFEEQGFRGTTVVQIAARAGVSVNTIYTSVGGKPHLLTALIDAAATAANEWERSGVQDATSGGEVIAAFAAGTRRVLEQHEWLLGEVYETAGTEPQVRDRLAEPEAAYRRRVMTAAGRLAELGDLRADLTVDRAADIVWFYFGFAPWRELRAAQWDWPDAEEWLGAQASHALLEHSAPDPTPPT
jgi:AcrR family transcriptional regulator